MGHPDFHCSALFVLISGWVDVVFMTELSETRFFFLFMECLK